MSSTENATAEATVTCPNCGAESKDPEWCDVCGAQLNPPSTSIPWLEVGSVFTFTYKDDKKRLARVVDLTEVYSTRRVGMAQVCPEGQEGRFFSREELDRHGFESEDATAELAESSSEAETCEFPTMSGESVLFEETVNEPSLQPTHLPDNVLDLVYTPFARMKRGPERTLEVFDTPLGHPLQEYLEGLERLLTLEEAAGVALLLMDAVERVHNAGLLHFQICPWTIRVITSEDKDEAPIEEASTPSVDELRLVFEGIRGFYMAEEEIRSHPVIMGFSPPEFFGRSQGPLNQHADIFAIGMLFYYLLAGGPPPSGSLTRNTPCLPLRAFRFAMPPGLQPFIDGCTHPEPSERFETVAETRKGLLAALDVAHRRDANRRSESSKRLSFYCAVDRHIGIGKGRRSPINQDSVFMGHDPDLNLSLIAVGDGVSTASFGSGDIASTLLVEACSDSWSKRHDLKQQLVAYARAEAEADDPIALEATLPDGIDLPEISDEERALDPEATLDSNELLALPEAEVGEATEGEASTDSKEAGPKADSSTTTIDETHTPPERELLRGRIGLTGNRSAPPLLETPAAQFIRDVLTDANDSISAHINERFAPFNGPVHEVMGTTSITAILHDDLITLASLGDSRAYLLRNGHMERLTRDHNLTTLRMIEGFSADESLLLPHGKALARCLGTFQVTQGRLKAIKPEPDLVTFRIMAGDTLLLTTDGLIDFGGPTEAAAERNIQTILEAEEIPSIACLKLIVLANEGGGEDNIGMAVIRVTERKDAGGLRGVLVQSFPPTELLRSNA